MLSTSLRNARASGAFSRVCGCFPRSGPSKTENCLQTVLTKIVELIDSQTARVPRTLETSVFPLVELGTDVLALRFTDDDARVGGEISYRLNFPQQRELDAVNVRYLLPISEETSDVEE